MNNNENRVYILDTMFGEEAGVQVFVNGRLEVTFFNSSGLGLKILLESLGHRNIALQYVENEEERNFVLDSLGKLWRKLECSI